MGAYCYVQGQRFNDTTVLDQQYDVPDTLELMSSYCYTEERELLTITSVMFEYAFSSTLSGSA